MKNCPRNTRNTRKFGRTSFPGFLLSLAIFIVGLPSLRAGLNVSGSFAPLTVAWANIPSAASSTGSVVRVSDIGPSGFGSLWVSNGTRWSPLGGTLKLAKIGAAQSGIANTETIVLQTLIPAGAWQTNDTLRIWTTVDKSGTTDALVANVRVGTTGTTSDAAVVAAFGWLATASRSVGVITDIRLASATSAQRTGTAAGSSYSAASTADETAAVTITNASSNALYVSVSIQSNGATNTVGISHGSIELITP